MEPVRAPATDDLQSLQEFLRHADALGMPEDERCAILGVPPGEWAAFAAGGATCAAMMTAGVRRRLDYVVPLLGRAVANRPRTAASSPAAHMTQPMQ